MTLGLPHLFRYGIWLMISSLINAQWFIPIVLPKIPKFQILQASSGPLWVVLTQPPLPVRPSHGAVSSWSPWNLTKMHQKWERPGRKSKRKRMGRPWNSHVNGFWVNLSVFEHRICECGHPKWEFDDRNMRMNPQKMECLQFVKTQEP